jgi:hypothetical protein
MLVSHVDFKVILNVDSILGIDADAHNVVGSVR